MEQRSSSATESQTATKEVTGTAVDEMTSNPVAAASDLQDESQDLLDVAFKAVERVASHFLGTFRIDESASIQQLENILSSGQYDDANSLEKSTSDASNKELESERTNSQS